VAVLCTRYLMPKPALQDQNCPWCCCHSRCCCCCWLLQVAICVSRVLKAYSNRADLTARMPGFRVQMGFGLHVGWAIEGAIGKSEAVAWGAISCHFVSCHVVRCHVMWGDVGRYWAMLGDVGR
jgi:hypothetical protein